MHLVDEHDGALRVQTGAGGLGFFHRLTDVLHAAQHGADTQELGIKGIGHQAGDGGFADPRRAPQDAAVWLARLKGQAQRHALTQQVLLANHLAQVAWAQALGQRGLG